MKGKQTMFFALLQDMEHILGEVEAQVDIRYYKMGMFDKKPVPVYESIFDAPNVGFALADDWNLVDAYLVMKKKERLNIREVPQRAGGIRFAIDQEVNLNSIELKLGGKSFKKENMIVAGRLATISSEKDSDELYKLFSKKIKKAFKYIDGFYVGKTAEEKLREGWRLVTTGKIELDLTIPHV